MKLSGNGHFLALHEFVDACDLAAANKYEFGGKQMRPVPRHVTTTWPLREWGVRIGKYVFVCIFRSDHTVSRSFSPFTFFESLFFSQAKKMTTFSDKILGQVFSTDLSM